MVTTRSLEHHVMVGERFPVNLRAVFLKPSAPGSNAGRYDQKLNGFTVGLYDSIFFRCSLVLPLRTNFITTNL